MRVVPPHIAVQVVPYYAQVMLFDPDDPDSLGVPETGEEAVVATASGLTVATRSDFVAAADAVVPITVEVWRGEGAPAGLTEVWTGELRVGRNGLRVGMVVGNDLHAVELPSGDHAVRVLVDPPEAAERVIFAIA